MRCRVIQIALLFIIQLSAWAQTSTPITGSYRNLTLSEILSEWSSDYGLDFAFDSYELSKYRFTAEFRSQPVEEALALLLAKAPFAFRQLDGTFVIFPVANTEAIAPKLKAVEQTLSGKVVDALSGESLPFAVVALLRSGSTTTCDEFGNFSLIVKDDISLDTLVAAYVGYSILQWPLISVQPDKELRLALVPQSTMLDDVTVEGRVKLSDAPSTGLPGIFIKPDDEQARFGMGEADVFRLAQQQAGVAGSLEISNGLVIRGGAPDQSLLMMDGFTVYHQDHFFGMFSAINASAVKSMRLHKTIMDVELGGRASGALELWGKEGDLRKPSGQLECGTLSISGAVEAPLDSSGKASVFLCGRRSLTNAVSSPAYKELFNTLYSGAVAYGSNSKVDAFDLNFKPSVLFQDINAKFTYHPSEKTRINLSFYASRDDMEFAYADTADSQLIDVVDIRYNDETTKMNRGLALRWQQRYNERVQSNTVVGLSLFEGNYFSTDSITNNLFLLDTNQFSAREIGLRDLSVKHQWQWNRPTHEWKAGASLNAIRTSDDWRSSLPVIETNEQSATVLTLFAGDSWRPYKNWMIYHGNRLSFFRERKQLYLEPRIAVDWQVIPKRLNMRLTAIKSLQFVQRTSSQNLYQNAPDVWQPAIEDVPVLKSHQLALALIWRKEMWSIELEGYRKWNQGQVTNAQAFALNSGSSAGSTSVAGNADYTGADVQLGWSSLHHKVLLNYSWMNARAHYPSISQGAIREWYYRNHEVKANYRWAYKGWSCSFIQVLTDGAPYTSLAGVYTLNLPGAQDLVLPVAGSPSAAQTPWYFRTDVVAGYEWNWGAHRLTLNAAVYNVFDRTNIRAVQYNVKPNEQNPAGYDIVERSIQMIGRMPTAHLVWQF
jgi:ferric enterobactin receptor